MGVGLSGNLSDFSIADVFQLIGQQRKTGVLELKNANTRVHLLFDRGAVPTAAPAGGRLGDSNPLGQMMLRCGRLTRDRVSKAEAASRNDARTFAHTLVEFGWVDAEEVREIEDLLTKDTIFEVLRWESGSFDFRPQDVHHDRPQESMLGAEQILMDGLRMLDEWQSFAHLIPGEDAVFRRVGRFESYREQKKSASPVQLERAQRMLSLVDGRLTMRRVIDLSRLGTFDATRALAELVEVSLIEPLPAQGVELLRKQDRAQASRQSRAKGGAVASVVAVAVPLVLLGAAVFFAQSSPSSVVAPPIENRSLEWVREAYATRRVRNALDAYRVATGDWPRALEDVRTRGYIDREALAAPAGRPYYSVSRADGFVFLAPEY